MTEDLTQRAANAIRAAACTGDCGQTEEECAKERIQPFVWHHGRLAAVEGSPEMFAAAVLAELKPELNALAALREVARGYCPQCGRGDAAPTVADWERERQRADEAEARLRHLQASSEAAGILLTRTTDERDQLQAAIARVRALAIQSRDHAAAGIDDYQIGQHDLAVDILAKLDEPASGPAATEATDGWTPPPPGDRREQLPDHLLDLIGTPAYLSTACEAAALLARQMPKNVHQRVELGDHADRLHARCRLQNKFTGVACRCHCHGATEAADMPS